MFFLTATKFLGHKHLAVWTCIYNKQNIGYFVQGSDENKTKKIIEILTGIKNQESLAISWQRRFAEFKINAVRIFNSLIF